ncbi:DUF4350 domain-containing protein [Halorubrum lipolyticum]
MAVDQDRPIVAFGVPFATNGVQFGQYGNEEVLLNVFDAYADSDTVLWDEGHGQFYDLASHESFAGYAEDNGYVVEATTDLEDDLFGPASAIVITSPTDSFSTDELDALASFSDAGGLVVLMDQSDFDNFDETDNLNALANGIDSQIRFNDNQVEDGESNDGADFAPTTTALDTGTYPDLLADRDGLGLELDPSEEYEVEVVSVADGDTVDVQFDNELVETVRTLGHDSPETSAGPELPEEWEGIDDVDTLLDYGDEATTYAQDQLPEGETVTISFDENEGLRGDFGRLLGLVTLDDGTLYNEALVADGYGRVYDSGLGLHDQLWSAEAEARANDRGVWAESDVSATPVVGDGPVDELFVPYATAVAAADGGSVPDDRVPVESEDGDPLVGVDVDSNVALVGGPLPDESFESGEGGPGTEPYGNYVFLANLIDAVLCGRPRGRRRHRRGARPVRGRLRALRRGRRLLPAVPGGVRGRVRREERLRRRVRARPRGRPSAPRHRPGRPVHERRGRRDRGLPRRRRRRDPRGRRSRRGRRRARQPRRARRRPRERPADRRPGDRRGEQPRRADNPDDDQLRHRLRPVRRLRRRRR